MAVYTTPDGRVVIGTGVTDRNDYHGYNGKRDIVIQLTADGATDDGLNALEYLKAYATNAKAENKPIFPDGTRVFISANGYTKAVEADDVVIDGDNITIGGIAWNGSAWDFSNAGQSGGGSGLPTPTSEDIGKVATVVSETSKGAVVVPEQTVTCDGENETLMSNTVPSLFKVGQKVWITLTMDGEDPYEVESTVEMEYVSELVMRPVAEFDDGWGKIVGTNNGLALYLSDALTVNCSVNVAETEANWGIVSKDYIALRAGVNVDADYFATIKTAILNQKPVVAVANGMNSTYAKTISTTQQGVIKISFQWLIVANSKLTVYEGSLNKDGTWGAPTTTNYTLTAE